MNPVRMFCRDRLIPQSIEEAFVAYCKFYLKEKYGISMKDTLSLVGDKISDKEVADLWNQFIMDMRNALLSQEKVSELQSPADK